jgi:riboflavin synthase
LAPRRSALNLTLALVPPAGPTHFIFQLSMFTGIVTGTFPIVELTRQPGLSTFAVELDAKHTEGLVNGASISLDGVCMTVTKVAGPRVYFDAAAETLSRTTLGQLKLGSRLNVERSAKSGAEIGGHPMSGHVDGLAQITAIERPENNCVITFRLPPTYARYVFNKGFVSLNGCSLTVCDLDKKAARFRVFLIPETLRLTTFGESRVGDAVNFEIDRQTQVIVDTIDAAVERALTERKLG